MAKHNEILFNQLRHLIDETDVISNIKKMWKFQREYLQLNVDKENNRLPVEEQMRIRRNLTTWLNQWKKIFINPDSDNSGSAFKERNDLISKIIAELEGAKEIMTLRIQEPKSILARKSKNRFTESVSSEQKEILIPFLQKHFTAAGPQAIVLMLFALWKNNLFVDPKSITNKTQFYSHLADVFQLKGHSRSFTTQIQNIGDRLPAYHKELLEVYSLLEDFKTS